MIQTQLDGRVALVTGGSRGIGAATAVALAEAGAAVSLTYHHGEDRARAVAERITTVGGQAIALPLDMQDSTSIKDLITRTRQRFGRIDILVNNAAVGSASVNHYADAEAVDEAMLRINILGVLQCTQAVLPGMVEQDYGKIVNVSSVGGGISVFPGFRTSDGMSKSAVAFLTRQIVADHPYRRIDAFSICPGAVDTRMFRESTLDPMSTDERAAFVSRLPGGRLIQPGEIADLILFLCTPAATVCRGAVIDASLGLGVRPGLASEKGDFLGRE